jgi:acetylornithine/N-succinyldiaminopimelate aminotransferase
MARPLLLDPRQEPSATSQLRGLGLEQRNMSGASSDSAKSPSDPIEAAITSDALVATGPLDFSGASLGFPDFTEPGQPTDEPLRAPELALETADLSDALCAKITPVSFGDHVFLFHSEAEARRFAIETIRRHHRIVGRPKRRRLIVCSGLSDDGASGAPLGLEGDDEVTLLRTDDPGALATEIDARTAGILIAPVRTNAGFEIVPGGLLARLRETADEYGLVLAYDESFSGLGRTGMLWAHEWTGVTPDVMIVHHHNGDAPLVALILTQRLARSAPERPPLLARATLLNGHGLVDALTAPGFLERVQSRGWRLEDRLTELFYKRRGAFTAQRGHGLMQGFDCPGEAEPMRAMLAEHGLLTRAMGSFLGLFPPLTVEESEIDAAVSIIDAACARETQ